MTLCTIARQVPLSMGFSRQECWSGLPRPPPGDLPDPGIEPVSLQSPKLTGGFVTTSATWGSPSVSPEKTEIPGGQIEQLLSGDTQEFKTRLAWFLIFPGYHRDSKGSSSVLS